MTTRRQALEFALAAERAELWIDLADAYRDDPYSEWTARLIRRIRRASEALGYPSSVEAIPLRWLWLYQFVETVPALGITAQWFDPEQIEDYEERIDRIPDEVRTFHRWALAQPQLGDRT